jgi:uncharacterized protein (TIGR02270 family)
LKPFSAYRTILLGPIVNCRSQTYVVVNRSTRTPEPHRIKRPPIPIVLMQHVQEAAHLRHVRSVLVRAPHVGLLHLARLDERIAAHLDGIAVGGGYGAGLADQALERLGTGEVFVATVCAIENRSADRLEELLAITETWRPAQTGLLSAFGWVSPAQLQGIARPLLEAIHPRRRESALAACAMHAVDPGLPLTRALGDDDAWLRARALRFAGRFGRRELVDACLSAVGDKDERSAFEAARSALLLGDRTDSLRSLEALAVGAGGTDSPNFEALAVVLKVVTPKRARAMLASLAKDPAQIRTLIRGIAIDGDPHYIPWLIAQMEDLKLARVAGEAFSLITGLDLAYMDLECKPPDSMEFGPNDDPNDENVSMDEDESLPWPDPAKLDAWWKKNGSRFAPGTRYFMGDEPTPQKCLEVLKTGFQRQRIAAAEYRTLLTPGTPLFNVAAPSWRQQRLLAGTRA